MYYLNHRTTTKKLSFFSINFSGYRIFVLFVAIMLGGFNLLGKFSHDILINGRIQILTQHIDEPPIANVQFTRERTTGFHGNHAIAGIKQTWSEFGHEDDAGTVEKIKKLL